MASALFEESAQDRSEAATPRRRSEAEREGRVPHSAELSAALVLLAATAVLSYAGGGAIARETTDFLRRDLDALATAQMTAASAAALLRAAAGHLLFALLPFGLAVAGIALVSGLVQGRGVVSTARIAPKLSNISPLRGLGRILSLQGAFNLAKALVKLLVLGIVTWFTLRDAWPEVTGLTAAAVPDVLGVVHALGLKLGLHVGFAFLAVAAADYGFERYQYERSLRMTKQEVKQEARETEGDPLMKSRIRSLSRQMARKRMLRDVAKADVVVTNPTHIAVALRYDALRAGAPIVLAMGERKLAERIKALATQAGVPLVENRPLAHALLATAKVGQQIPAALYAAVAEVLAYVYRRRGGPSR